MRRRAIVIPIFFCLVTPILLYLLGSFALNRLQDYERSEEEKVKEWQHKHLPKQDDDVAPLPSTTQLPEIEESEEVEDIEDIERITASTRKVSEEIPEEWPEPPTTTTSTVATTESTTVPTTTITVPTTTTTTVPTTTTESTTVTTTVPITTTESTTTTTTSTTPPTPPTTTTRIRTWTYPTRRPPIYDPNRHRYGQDRVTHHHHHHHHDHTTTTQEPTTTTQAPPPSSTTTRIRVTTPAISSSSNSIYDRITIPSIPPTSSYRNPYIQKIAVTSSTYVDPTTTTTGHRHHHHHHHNRTHIDIHAHHRHHMPYPQFPYPNFPSILYPSSTTTTTEAPTTTTTTTTEPPTTTVRHHHHGHHRHHHSSTTNRPSTTTTTRMSELDHWGFVLESEEELKSSEEESTTTSSTTTTTTTTTPAPTPAPTPRAAQNIPGLPRHRQPEPPTPPIKRVEREATIVTGFLDIGRGDWSMYRRPLEIYHDYMETLLNLRNNFVVFTDDSSYDFVVKTRTKYGLMNMTKVYNIKLEDLPLYGYINEAKKIIDDELKNDTFYRTIGDVDMRSHPEANSAEYNIVVNSKTHFLQNVTIENPFNSEHFIWIDAGYGHANENFFPYSYKWRPALPDGKISLIKVTPDFDDLKKYDLPKLYRKNVALISGGFIAGDKHAIGQLHSIIHRKFIQLIYQNRVDDDQTLLTLAVNSFPQLFHVVYGDWFDAFRLFDTDPEVQLG